jgi:subtilase family serine protease
MVAAACPECHILLVEAKNNEPSNLLAAVEEAVTLKATEISNSYGAPEFSEETSLDKYFNHPNIPILASAGDDEYAGCSEKLGAGLCWPAASQYVISVGGTKLTKEPKSPRGWTEEVWFEAANKKGTGSGCSVYEPKPKWQTDKTCAKRIDNDVAAVASAESAVSVYDSYLSGGWGNFGGTSASSPFVAGVEALSTSYARSLGAEAFYLAGKSGLLFDVTKGSNGTCTPPAENEYFCTAKAAYDGPTGNGAPNGPLVLATPTVTTGSASSVKETEVTLHGTVNPNGLETKYYFEYGSTTSYGAKTTEASAGYGTGSLEETSVVTGLTANATYHYRIVAVSSAGTAYGSDQTFLTEGIGSRPAAVVAGAGFLGKEELHNAWVYYVNNNHEIAYWVYTPYTGWTNGVLGGSVEVGSSPAVARSSKGDQFVYYIGKNGAVWEWNFNAAAGKWSDIELGGSATARTSPSVARIDNSGNIFVFYFGKNEAVWEWNFNYNALKWSDVEL